MHPVDARAPDLCIADRYSLDIRAVDAGSGVPSLVLSATVSLPNA
ncbi:hypothetical protein [Bradyrhizobium sp. SRS-191]|nr:hypothetical protein [Bradyrhizobium sp. SRS-191]